MLKFKKGITPIRLLPIGFLIIIIIGTFLLMLPVASTGESVVFFDALFTATSASCVTGLVVVDTGTQFTLFGQIVILCLIQVGGLGFMVVVSALFIAIGHKISLRERMTIAESLGEERLQGVVGLAGSAIKLALSIEAIGAVLLATKFVPDFGFAKGVWYSIFHSVSAFCNAGFDLMGNYSSLTSYVNDPLVNFTLMMLIVLGGLGFVVLLDIFGMGNTRRLRLHSKIVLVTNAFIIVVSTLLIFMQEYDNTATIANMNIFQKLQASLFQSVTCRTAGFNTIEQTGLTEPSKLVSTILMFIGGAPAGTAGGVKVTTIAVLLLTVRAYLHQEADTQVFGRRLSSGVIRRALSIFIIVLAVLLTSLIVVLMLERGSGYSFIDSLFEVTSAIGTVGVSMGITGSATIGTQILLCILMFGGRVGIITLALALSGRELTTMLRYPEEEIMVG